MSESIPYDKAAGPADPDEAGGAVGRRAFIGLGVTLVGAVYGAAIGYPVYRYLSTPSRREASAAYLAEL